MARKAGIPDRSSLRFTPEKVRLARMRPESASGPIWGELNVLLYGSSQAPEAEEWRLIRGGDKPPHYWLSDRGNFAVWRETPARIWERKKYRQAVVYFNGQKCPRAIHMLVAKAFCKWNADSTQIRHLDSNPHNNNVNNLKPGRREENDLDRKNRVNGITPCILPPDKECWKLSTDHPGLRVSNMGNVKLGWWLVFNTKGCTIKTGRRKGQKKHVNVTICESESGSHKTELLHRLVYEAFNGKIPANMFVTHRNDDQHDNRKENLILGTGKQNAADRIRNGKQLFGEKHPNSKYSDAQKSHFLDLYRDGLSVTMASAKAGINSHTGRQIMWRLNNGLIVKIDRPTPP